MAYEEALAHHIRTRLSDHPGLTEREMFGGIAFMINGHMAVGVAGEELIVRVGREAHDEAIARPGTRVFDMSSRPMRGWILVSPVGYRDDVDLDDWLSRGAAFAESLAPK
ncbi:MAG: TfoX/Sxy family protein [Acidimicrobiia bacterium]